MSLGSAGKGLDRWERALRGRGDGIESALSLVAALSGEWERSVGA